MTTLHGKEVKVGSPVWDSLMGWTKVIAIDEVEPYPIVTNENTYTNKGLVTIYNKSPQLFWQEFKVPTHAFEKPKVKVKKYIVLFISLGNYITTSDWKNKYFSSKEDFDEYNDAIFREFISLILESEIEVEE